LGGKGDNKGFEEKATGLGGVEIYFSVNLVTLIGGGVVNPRVGKYFEVLGLNQGTTSGEIGVTRLSPSNPKPGGENSS
jgi:hypothetical protein